MQCKLDEMALSFFEKKKLQKFLKEHEKICPDIKAKCNYSLSFSSGIVKVKCKECGIREQI